MNRSLSRGLAILECFRPGVGFLAHRDIAEKTGLPKPTLTRLLQTLRSEGYLVEDRMAGGYRLGMPILSLARTFTLNNGLGKWMAPVIERIALQTQSIIGFGTAHNADIVYLVAVNGDSERPDRCVGPGMRAPILSTSVGRAYLAGLDMAQRTEMLDRLRSTAPWRSAFEAELCLAFAQFKREGICLVDRSGGRQVAAGIALHVNGEPLHALGIGYRLPGRSDPTVVPTRIWDAINELHDAAERFERSC